MGYVKWEMFFRVFTGLVLIFKVSLCGGLTDPRDGKVEFFSNLLFVSWETVRGSFEGKTFESWFLYLTFFSFNLLLSFVLFLLLLFFSRESESKFWLNLYFFNLKNLKFDLFLFYLFIYFFAFYVSHSLGLFVFLVMAMNNLYIALGYPPLRGWLLVGGDPCGDNWQGIQCVFSNITAM